MTEVTGIKEIIKPENLVYKKSAILTENILHYCPGCGHGTAHRILAEIIEEEGLQSGYNRCFSCRLFCLSV